MSKTLARSASSSWVSRSNRNVAKLRSFRAFATARFRGLRWLDPLPCAKTINPFEFLTTLRVPAKPCGGTTTSDDVTECGWIMAPCAFEQTSEFQDLSSRRGAGRCAGGHAAFRAAAPPWKGVDLGF